MLQAESLEINSIYTPSNWGDHRNDDKYHSLVFFVLSALIQDQHLQIYFSARQSIYSHILIAINLFTQRKAVKRPSNVIWTAICPLLCSIRGSFRGHFLSWL